MKGLNLGLRGVEGLADHQAHVYYTAEESFEVTMPSYPGYSKDFFDGCHYVLLGASWATDKALIRRSFRNWFQPHYPYVFSKFRCTAPA